MKKETDAEAWKFLIEMGGDFRIHTNKNGLVGAEIRAEYKHRYKI